MNTAQENSGKQLKNIRFHYLKSNFFRVLHIDGAIGGITPDGHIHASLYNERVAIPREVNFAVNEDGTLGDPEETVSRDGIVREMEVDVMMNMDTAVSLRNWLNEQISKLEARIKEQGK